MEEEESCAVKELKFKPPRPPVVCAEVGRGGVGPAGRPGAREEESVSRSAGGREKEAEAVAGGGKCTPSIVSGKHRINHARFSLRLCRVILIAPGKNQTREEASGGGRGGEGIVFAIQQASSGGKFLVMFATGTRYLHFASIRGSSGGTRALPCHVVTGPQLSRNW